MIIYVNLPVRMCHVHPDGVNTIAGKLIAGHVDHATLADVAPANRSPSQTPQRTCTTAPGSLGKCMAVTTIAFPAHRAGAGIQDVGTQVRQPTLQQTARKSVAISVRIA